MNWIISVVVVALFGLAACARLDNLYLPPGSGGQSGSQSAFHSGPGAAAISGVGGAFHPSPTSQQPQIPILRLDSSNDGDGNYNYAYETGNGIAAQEQGHLRGDIQAADGSFSFTSPEGQQFSITYTADENGFHPQGAHIPTAPPIPDAILKSLEQNREEEARGIVDDGQYRPEAPQAKYGAPAPAPAQLYRAPITPPQTQFRAPSPSHSGGGNGGYRY